MAEILPPLAVEGVTKHEMKALRAKSPESADAVLDPRSHHLGRVDVAIDVGLDQSIHRDAAQATDQLRVVRDFLRAQDDLALELRHPTIQVGRRLGAERKGGGRGDGQFAGVQQVQHPVLDDFGIGGHPLERAVHQARQHRIGDIADAGLQRQQTGRQAPDLHLVLQELDQMAGDGARRGVGRGEGQVAVRRMVSTMATILSVSQRRLGWPINWSAGSGEWARGRAAGRCRNRCRASPPAPRSASD